MINILNTIGEDFNKEAKKMLDSLGNVKYQKLSKRELQKIIQGFDVLIIGLDIVLDKKILAKAKKLKVIATATTGLDHIDVAYSEEKNIEIISLKEDLEFMKKITGTAELTWGLLIALLRKIPSAFDSVKGWSWKREEYKGHSLSGKTLGILGLGRLGSIVAGYGKAFGMKVIFTDPNVLSFEGARKLSFEELLKESDVLSLHVHLSKDTEHMISNNALNLMKKNAVVINTARGKIVDEEALLQALREGRIAGYATDVLSGELEFKEKISNSNSLVAYAKENNNVIIVPHIGGITYESRIQTDIRIAEKVAKYVKDKYF